MSSCDMSPCDNRLLIICLAVGKSYHDLAVLQEGDPHCSLYAPALVRPRRSTLVAVSYL